MNIIGLEQIEYIYEMTTPRWISSEQLYDMGGQLKIPYIPGVDCAKADLRDPVPIEELRYYLIVKDKRTFENGKVEYFVEFVDW